MKKLFGFLKIILIIASITSLIILSIYAVRIYRGKSLIEGVTGQEITYFSDQSLFTRSYYKYNDEKGTEYWINSKTGDFVYLYDAKAVLISTSVSQGAALKIAYDEAKKWNSSFFEYSTSWKAVENTIHEFYIMQLDAAEHRTGKFIVVKVSGKQVEYMSMHTIENTKDSKFNNCINEQIAVETAYSMTASSEKLLLSQDNHLYRSGFYNEDEKWIWEIKLWNITQSEIEAMSATIDKDNYFLCTIDAVTGEVLSSEWIQLSTNYCPLTGEVLN